jgi:hypothetical protein
VKLTLPDSIVKDMSDCINSIDFLPDVAMLKQMGMLGVAPEDISAGIKSIYGI